LNPEDADAVTPSQPESPAITAESMRELDFEQARRAQEGDRQAMEALVLRHQAAVARLLWRFARTPADLDDLVQDTFLRMVRGLPSWRAELPFSHWLLRIATNVGRDYFRRHAVRRRWMGEVPPEREGSGSAADAIDPGADPAARAAANEVKAMLAALSPDDRTVLTLHHLEGWDMARIAAQFGWTVTATKLRAWRARRELRALLERNKDS
jgi:RNA polymerase sigma-70 factor (ECF subfamily)